MADEFATIAVIHNARGNKGEVAAESQSSHPERFQQLQRVFLLLAGQRREAAVENTWWHGEKLVLKFAGVDSISDAEALAGAEVQIPLSERVPLAAGEVYLSDLLDLTVKEKASGQEIGKVTAWQEVGGPPLLVVEGAQGQEILVPFVRAWCQVDLERREILADLPDGLVDLNP